VEDSEDEHQEKYKTCYGKCTKCLVHYSSPAEIKRKQICSFPIEYWLFSTGFKKFDLHLITQLKICMKTIDQELVLKREMGPYLDQSQKYPLVCLPDHRYIVCIAQGYKWSSEMLSPTVGDWNRMV